MSTRNDATLLTRAVASRLGRPPGPFKLTVALTWVCDQRCTHCSIWARKRSDELSAGEWRRVWREASGRLSWLDLTGGEVTSRRDFAEIAIAAIEECPRLALLHFPSNGRKPERLERVARAVQAGRPARLIVSLSLDGPPEVHDRLRGDDGGFHRTVDSYRRLRRLGVETYFGMTLSPWNLELVDATYEALRAEVPELTWRDLHVNFLHESAHYFGNQGIERNDPAALREAIARFRRRRGAPRHPTHVLEHLYLRHVPEYLETGRSPLPCTSLQGNAFIDPTGQVFPCHIWDRPIASVRDHDYSLPAIWRLDATRRARADVESDRCPGCWTPCEAYPTLLANPLAAVT